MQKINLSKSIKTEVTVHPLDVTVTTDTDSKKQAIQQLNKNRFKNPKIGHKMTKKPQPKKGSTPCDAKISAVRNQGKTFLRVHAHTKKILLVSCVAVTGCNICHVTTHSMGGEQPSQTKVESTQSLLLPPEHKKMPPSSSLVVNASAAVLKKAGRPP